MANLPKDIDPRWARLREATPARIGLARTGSAIATRDHLAFQLDHARARDAVTEALDPQR
jgi:ethanolamine ammonia-lyase small subunit